MTEKIIIAGAGGQGIMLLGKVLAQAAMQENKFVTWLPSYGAEVRGGTAHCMVVISSNEIGSPYIDKADSLIIMNAPSLERFQARLKNKGLLIINSSLAKSLPRGEADLLSYPFTDIALVLGNIRIANMVALGCYIAQKKIVDKKNIFQAIADIAPVEKRNLIEINRQAILKGMELVK
ncbi:MAG: 2-oxoacid:acceptor oxidoreductase family protein [Candidatus Omnitrophica bacterium]|nr:2-oxoacid:acceptor oxidoreductase family protein [Candidatus Omnitrophota bacterium]